jgi:hypothetical protein
MDRSQNGRRIYHKLIIGLYAIVFALPATAQQAPSNTNIAGPSASATGNVTNQAVQVLQGPFAVNTYGSGVSCQGPTLNLQTFGYNSLSNNSDPTTFQQNSINAGVSAGFSVPLDGSFQELCKARVRTEITRQQAEADKARLDFELVRLLKCGEAIKSGISFHPESPYAKICADVVVKYPKVQDVVNGNKNNQSIVRKN